MNASSSSSQNFSNQISGINPNLILQIATEPLNGSAAGGLGTAWGTSNVMATAAQQAQRANRGTYHSPWDNIFLVSYLDVQPNDAIQADTLRVYERNGRLFASERMPSQININDKPDIEVIGYNFDPRFRVPPVPRRIEDIKERYNSKTTQLPPSPTIRRRDPNMGTERDPNMSPGRDPKMIHQSTSAFQSDLEYYPIAQRQ
jgi:hypothetical protein